MMRDAILRWYLGRDDVHDDAMRVVMGDPLAIIGGRWDDALGFAQRLAPKRALLNLDQRIPTARELRDLYAAQPDAVVVADRPERVVSALGLVAQPWYMHVSPLTARPHEAVRLLRDAIHQLGVTRPLEALGSDVIAGLVAYQWPRGLHELRNAATRLAAVLVEGNITAAARRLAVTRQAVSKYLGRRAVRH